MNPTEPLPDYREAYAEGAAAADGERCPFPAWMPCQHYAWLAGYNDARKESSDAR